MSIFCRRIRTSKRWINNGFILGARHNKRRAFFNMNAIALTLRIRAALLAAATVSFIGVSCSTTAPRAQTGIHELTREQWAAYYAVHDTWRRTIFPLCLKKNGLKLSCAGCESVYVRVRLYIGPDGKLARYEKTGGRACGETPPEKLERCFIEYFGSITFPKKLWNMIIETSLGNGLKC